MMNYFSGEGIPGVCMIRVELDLQIRICYDDRAATNNMVVDRTERERGTTEEKGERETERKKSDDEA